MTAHINSNHLLPLIRSSLKINHRAEAPDVWSATKSNGSQHRDPRFSAILEGILFSRRFILTYQLVLIAVLLSFTIWHWGSRLQSWRRRRRRKRRVAQAQPDASDTLSAASSSSSSDTLLESTVSTPKKEEEQRSGDEKLPLLPPKTGLPSQLPQPSWRNILKAWLAYQPAPIPVINKILPSNTVTLAVLALWGLQTFYIFYRTPLSIHLLFVFADRTSLLFVANLPLLYLLAAKNQPVKFLTGFSYEALNIFHRRLGEIMCLLALLHSAGMIGVWYTILRPTGFSLARFLAMRIILLGLGAFIAYELIYFTSLGSFRQRWYELFLGLHITLQVAALVLVWFHHHNSRPYVGAVFAIYIIDRIIFRVFLTRRTLQATLETTSDGSTVIVRADVPYSTSRLPKLLFGKTDVHSGWEPTEHVFLSMPALAPKHIIQAHPFTIAAKAPSLAPDKATQMQELKLIIRAQDGFSRDLLQYSQTHTTANIHLDGPYGSQTAVNLLNDSDIRIIVAGGSGIAVAWPLVWSLLSPPQSATDDHIETQNRTPSGTNILFIWTFHDAAHLSWLEPGALKSLKDQGVDVHIPPPTSKRGHPDLQGLIEPWTQKKTVTMMSTADHWRDHSRIGMVCSGPDGMNRCVRNLGASMIRKGYDLDVEIEKFGW